MIFIYSLFRQTNSKNFSVASIFHSLFIRQKAARGVYLLSGFFIVLLAISNIHPPLVLKIHNKQSFRYVSATSCR